jgi:hypothetical protein
MQQCHPHCGTELESRASTLGCKRMPLAFLGKAGAECEPAVDPGSRLADVDATGQITGGAMRRTEQERLADLEAKNTFQHRTLRAIRVVAEKAPPEEARRALPCAA